LQTFLFGFIRNDRAVVIYPVSNQRPSVISSLLDLIQLIATPRTVFDIPECFRVAIIDKSLRIPVAITPDLRTRAFRINKGVIFRNSTVVVETHDLAEMIGKRLGILFSTAFSRRKEHIAVFVKDDAASKVHPRVCERLSGKKFFEVLQLITLQSRPRDYSTSASFALLRIAEIDPAVVFIVRVEFDLHQTTLSVSIYIGYRNGLFKLNTVLENKYLPFPFCDENAPVGKKSNAPGVLEFGGQCIDAKRERLRRIARSTVIGGVAIRALVIARA